MQKVDADFGAKQIVGSVSSRGLSRQGKAWARFLALMFLMICQGWISDAVAHGQEFSFRMEDVQRAYLPGLSMELSTDFIVWQVSGPLEECVGLTAAVSHDPEVVSVTSVEPSALLESYPLFFGTSLLDDGYIVSTVWSGHFGTETLSFPTETVVARVTYESVASLPGGPQESPLTFEPLDDGGGWGLIENEIFGGYPNVFVPELDHGSIELTEGGVLRGDCNSDGSLNLADDITLLAYLFLGLQEPGCLVACDFNGDNSLGLSDAVFVEQYLFLMGLRHLLRSPTAVRHPHWRTT